jgi:ferritin-like metal-binding protein YciE
MPAPRGPEDILTTELKEIYSAERQLTRAIPKLTRRVSHPKLKEMLERRREQGEQLMGELDAAFEEMEVTKSRPKNVAAEGLLEDINEHLEEIKDEKLLDPVLLASIQKVEHYCIAAWGTAKSMGRLLGEDRVIQAMERVLDEGKRFDEELTQIAESEVNPAMLASEEEGEEQEDTGGKSRGKGGGKGEARPN